MSNLLNLKVKFLKEIFPLLGIVPGHQVFNFTSLLKVRVHACIGIARVWVVEIRAAEGIKRYIIEKKAQIMRMLDNIIFFFITPNCVTR